MRPRGRPWTRVAAWTLLLLWSTFFCPLVRASHRRSSVHRQLSTHWQHRALEHKAADETTPKTQRIRYRSMQLGDVCGRIAATRRIVNGDVAQRGQFPWQAALMYAAPGQGLVALCGGALVHPRFVLTAAHCLAPSQNHGVKAVEVRLGATNWSQKEEGMLAVKADRLIFSSDFAAGLQKGFFHANDVGLVRLASSVTFTGNIRPVCLPTKGDSPEPKSMEVSGWGAVNNKGPRKVSQVLRFTSLPWVARDECGRAMNVNISQSQICAGGGKSNTCVGDSGGPLVRKKTDPQGNQLYELIGIVSFGNVNNCAQPGFPSAYTRVASYIPWIESTIKTLL